VIITGEFIIII